MLIATEIVSWDLQDNILPKYVGTGRKTMFELAMRTRPAVQPVSIQHHLSYSIPADYE
jgi:hypothetical protein